MCYKASMERLDELGTTRTSSSPVRSMRKTAAALLLVAAVSLVPVSSAGAQNPAYPPDTYIANVLTTGYDAGHGAYLIKVINYNGLGIIQGAWSDPTWGIGFFAAWFDFCASNNAGNAPPVVAVELYGLVASSTNPVPHVNAIAVAFGAATQPTPPISTGLYVPDEGEIGGGHIANTGYAFIGPSSC
ncbi:MAG: hypothetical protein JJLCMIEE_03015 [Acidimicrobiales bacterium]|nr:MAG: hypothetical protein EDR02_16995 [Actinomycetota bacterium]MBV6509900.1 hypothetical protein [Acidimicrobiales bacterium]RIK03282.1 MAG: hypothetical protein DCC48_16800 [Acidobacteriota bacterium]